MRTPSSLQERWAWYEAAIAGENPPIHDGEPHAGFFKVRKFSYGKWVKGPFVPARIWWETPETDADGELISDEKLRAEIDGREVNPWNKWTWIARRPVTESEWMWLKALSPLLPDKIPGA